MEYQKKQTCYTIHQINNLDFKNLVDINDNSRGTYYTNSQIKFKTTILNSILYY